MLGSQRDLHWCGRPPIRRVAGSRPVPTVIDGTSAAGALPVDISQTDVYFTHRRRPSVPMAVCESPSPLPEAIDRAALPNQALIWKAHIAGICRFLSLTTALNIPRIRPEYARRGHPDRDGNQIRWLNNNGGLARAPHVVAIRIHPARGPSAPNTPLRSSSMRTHARTPWSPLIVDESGPLETVVLRENGIVDAAGYRKLGRNSCALACSPRWNRLMSWPSPVRRLHGRAPVITPSCPQYRPYMPCTLIGLN